MSSHTQTCKLHGGILRETQHVALEHQQNTYFFHQTHWFLGPCLNRSGFPLLIQGANVGNQLLFICLRLVNQKTGNRRSTPCWFLGPFSWPLGRDPHWGNMTWQKWGFHIKSFVLWAGPVPSHHHGLHASACRRRLECFNRVTGYFLHGSLIRIVSVHPPPSAGPPSVHQHLWWKDALISPVCHYSWSATLTKDAINPEWKSEKKTCWHV